MRSVILLAVAAVVSLGLAGEAPASVEPPPARDWPSDGVFGRYDRASLQRGFQVYREVCALCHGLKFIAFRNLTEIGLTKDQAKGIAAEYEVEDGPDDEGEMYWRTAILADMFPSPFANDQEARANNSDAFPPDLSLIVKARKHGVDYLYAILTGYLEPPEDVEVADGMSYNPYFPGQQIVMPQPLYDEGVEYADGTDASIEQMSADVTQFLTWAAEPELEERKRMGIKVMLFLLVLTGLFYAAKRKIWSKAH
jgi:ubiquinol-cytochrome c reductase cytochrome c1 subunit